MLGFIALTLLIVFSNIASVSAIDKTVIYHNRALVGVEKYKNAEMRKINLHLCE